jgi:hypothetical protein
MSDAEFLSFLYAEREREESLNSYQGGGRECMGSNAGGNAV